MPICSSSAHGLMRHPSPFAASPPSAFYNLLAYSRFWAVFAFRSLPTCHRSWQHSTFQSLSTHVYLWQHPSFHSLLRLSTAGCPGSILPLWQRLPFRSLLLQSRTRPPAAAFTLRSLPPTRHTVQIPTPGTLSQRYERYTQRHA